MLIYNVLGEPVGQFTLGRECKEQGVLGIVLFFCLLPSFSFSIFFFLFLSLLSEKEEEKTEFKY